MSSASDTPPKEARARTQRRRLVVEAFRTDALRQGFLATRNTGQPISVRQAALLSVSRGVTR